MEESLPAFHAMGKAEALNVSIGEYHHGWCNKNREAMYAFFASNLGNSEASLEEWWPSGFGNLSALFDASELQVTSTGQVRTAPECKTQLAAGRNRCRGRHSRGGQTCSRLPRSRRKPSTTRTGLDS